MKDMLYCPVSGAKDDVIFEGARYSDEIYRSFNQTQVWRYNPFTGKRRTDEEVTEDPQGLKL